jgi:site-specific recombinase XerD
MPKAKLPQPPWNKGKAVGQKAPFTPEQVHIIRHFLHAEGHLRDLALLNTAIDTLLRASDLLRLKVEDVTDHHGAVVEECTVRQHKTQAAQTVLLLEHSRQALAQWIAASSKQPWHYLFTAQGKTTPISRVQYSKLIKKWATYARLDPRKYSTHSLRRTKSSVVYARTGNLEVCRQILGHHSIANTALYLGVDKQQALHVARAILI